MTPRSWDDTHVKMVGWLIECSGSLRAQALYPCGAKHTSRSRFPKSTIVSPTPTTNHPPLDLHQGMANTVRSFVKNPVIDGWIHPALLLALNRSSAMVLSLKLNDLIEAGPQPKLTPLHFYHGVGGTA
jgi:hypothetical protein